jgi:hypothetical protein
MTRSNNKAVIKELPFSDGGGIGISRLLMLILRTFYIGEVHCGLWHDAHYKQVHEAVIDLIPGVSMSTSRLRRLSCSTRGLESTRTSIEENS